jgi:hypothetical protein
MEESTGEKCPHCHGLTKCRCVDCGKEVENGKFRIWKDGICKVCKSMGKI